MRTWLHRAVAAAAGAALLATGTVTTAAADRGSTPAGAKDCTSLPDAAQEPGPDSIEFADVTEDVGLLEPLKGMYGHATATGDVNGDGWLDLFVGTMKSGDVEAFQKRGAEGKAPDRLLLGGPDGFTVDEDFAEVPGDLYDTSGAVFTDLDNDGDLDLVVARGALGNASEHNDSVVLRNDNGNFTHAATLTEDTGARTIAVLDYDGDGLQDLFIVEDHYYNDADSKLLRNLGGFNFEDVTEEVGFPPFQGLGAASADFNGDGLPDLLLSGTLRTQESWDAGERGEQSTQFARLFTNTGGAFEEADASVFRMPTQHWVDTAGGVAVADLNRDGLLDVVVGNHIHSGGLLERGIPAARVYLHRGLDQDGSPQFEEVTEAAGIPDVNTRVPHVEIVDFDADGWPDLHTSLSRGDSTLPTTFRHTGIDETGVPQFSIPSGLGDERTSMPPPLENPWDDLVGIPRYWATGASADYDRDGRIDSFMVEWFPELPSAMFRNETTDTGNGLFVDVVPHADAIGAKVEVYCARGLGDADQLIGAREISIEVGYAAGLPTELHFGVGWATKVDLRVTLPNGGEVIERENVNVRADPHVVISADGPDARD